MKIQTPEELNYQAMKSRLEAALAGDVLGDPAIDLVKPSIFPITAIPSLTRALGMYRAHPVPGLEGLAAQVQARIDQLTRELL